MPFHAIRVIEIAAGAVVVAGLGAAGAWWVLRKRPSAEELEVDSPPTSYAIRASR